MTKGQIARANLISSLKGWMSQPGMKKHEPEFAIIINKLETITDEAWLINHAKDTNKEIIIAVRAI
jgi:hypothetical protein